MSRSLLLFAFLAASCAVGVGQTTTTTPVAESTLPDSAAEACSSGQGAFGAVGNLASLPRASTDATTLRALQVTSHPGCERLTILFDSDGGAPALDPPGVEARFLREAGVVRIALNEAISASAVHDQLIESSLVDRIFVVMGAGGKRFVDVHMADLALARVSTHPGPARIELDLTPGGTQYAMTPQVASGLVLMRPTGGPAYPLLVIGYSRIGSVSVQLTADNADERQATSELSATGGWFEYSVVFDDGPPAPVTVVVSGVVSGVDSGSDDREQSVRRQLEG